MSWAVTEQFLESQPGSGASFTVTGGFLDAATSVFKEARKNFAFDFLSNKDKQNFKNHQHIKKNYLSRDTVPYKGAPTNLLKSEIKA